MVILEINVSHSLPGDLYLRLDGGFGWDLLPNITSELIYHDEAENIIDIVIEDYVDKYCVLACSISPIVWGVTIGGEEWV